MVNKTEINISSIRGQTSKTCINYRVVVPSNSLLPRFFLKQEKKKWGKLVGKQAFQQCSWKKARISSFNFLLCSEDVILSHLEGRHGLVDILVQPMILHIVARTQAVPPAPTLG